MNKEIPTIEEAEVLRANFRAKCLEAAVNHLRDSVINRIEEGDFSISSMIFVTKNSSIWDYQWEIQNQAVDIVINEMTSKGWWVKKRSKGDHFLDDLFVWDYEAPKPKLKKKWWKW